MTTVVNRSRLGTSAVPPVAVQYADSDLAPECRTQLLQRDQLVSLGRLVAGVAHELNNPLAAVVGMLALMRDIVGERDCPALIDVPTLRELIVECEGAADRLRQLVASLKEMGRVGSREASLFDPAKAVLDAVRLFAVAKQRHCRVELTMSELPAVRGSSSRLGQVIINLLQNGLDAAGDGSTLIVRGDSYGSGVQILVSDEGPGISRDVAESIFQPFVSSKGEKGMGLGLSICREIVLEMSGAIDFETGPSGTTFCVALPGHQPAPKI